MADNFAYEITGPGSDLSDSFDLNTGAPVGSTALTLAGLGSAKLIQDALGIESNDVVDYCFPPEHDPRTPGKFSHEIGNSWCCSHLLCRFGVSARGPERLAISARLLRWRGLSSRAMRND
jgi:hypothetical protein